MSWLMQRVKEEFQIQADRYSRGSTISIKYGKLVAALLYYFIFQFISNLLHLTLPPLIEETSPTTAYIIVIVSTLVIITLAWNLSIMWVYKAKIPFFQQYRVDPERPWPWEVDYPKWQKTLRKSIQLTALAILVIAPLSLMLEVQLSFNIVLDMAASPTFTQMLPQFILMVFVEDIIFFTTHYLAHQHPYLYSYHKVHHEYTTSVSIAGLHFHVLQFIITQSISTLINARMARLLGPFHITTLCYWIVFRMWDAYNGHCGYYFSWAPLQLLPFTTNDQYHDFHHSHNCGNYCSHFRYLDWIAGSNTQYRIYKKQQDQKRRIAALQAKIK